MSDLLEEMLAGLEKGQRKAVERSGKVSFISAGAGTGKTFTLSKRVAYHMRSENIDPEEISAITFTEAAAAELKHRIRKNAIAAGIDDAEYMEAAMISTIHSMCKKTIAENSFEIGADPGVVIMTDDDTSEMLDAAVDEGMAHARYATSSRIAELMGSPAAVRNLVRALTVKSLTIPGGVEAMGFGPKPVSKPTRKAISRLVCALADFVDDCDSVAKPTAAVTGDRDLCFQLSNTLNSLSAPSWQDIQELLDDFSLSNRLGALKESRTYVTAEVKLLHSMSLVEPAAALIVPFVKARAMASAEAFKRMMSDARKFSFDALLSEAALLLADDETAERYSERYGIVMVDEFQDTDPLQRSIVERLCCDTRGLSKLITVGDRQQSIYAFRGADVTVSDDMQERMEEYDFDATVPLDVNFRSNEEILAFVDSVFSSPGFFGGDFLSLSASEFSADNKIEGRLGKKPAVCMCLSRATVRTPEAKYAILEDARWIAKEMRRIHDDPEATEHWSDMGLLLRSLGSVDIYIDAMRAEGIPCAITGGRHFYSFPEVASAVDLVCLLTGYYDEDCVFRLLSGEVVGISDDELATLKKIWSDKNREAGTERSNRLPLMSITDTEEVKAECPNVYRFFRIVEVCRKMFDTHSIEEVYMFAVKSTGWLGSVSKDVVGGQGRYANIVKVQDILSDLVGEHGEDLKEISDRLLERSRIANYNMRSRDNTEQPGHLIGAADDGFVSIMTIHASKGLEKNVVFVSHIESYPSIVDGREAGANKMTSRNGFTADGRRTMFTCIDLYGTDVSLGSILGDVAKGMNTKVMTDRIKKSEKLLDQMTSYTEYISLLKQLATDLDRQERDRIAYVALTRAKKKLYWNEDITLKGGSTPTNAGSVINRAWAALTNYDIAHAQSGTIVDYNGNPLELVFLDDIKIDDTPYIGRDIVRAAAEVLEPKEYGYGSNEMMSSFHTYTYDLSSYTQSELIGRGGNISANYKKIDELRNYESYSAFNENSMELHHKRASSPRDYGKAFHKLAQKMLNMNRLPNEDELTDVCSSYTLSNEEADNIWNALNNLVSSQIWQDIHASGTVMSEIELCFPLDGIDVRGVADLVHIDADNRTAAVYDYKVGHEHNTDAEIRDKYGMQAMIYAYALLLSGMVDSVDVSFLMVEKDMHQVIMPSYTDFDTDLLQISLEKAFAKAKELGTEIGA